MIWNRFFLSNTGSFPFVLHHSSSSLNSATIKHLNKFVSCLLDCCKAQANDALLIITPIFLTSSTFVTGTCQKVIVKS